MRRDDISLSENVSVRTEFCIEVLGVKAMLRHNWSYLWCPTYRKDMISLECGDPWPSTERSKGRWRMPSKPDARESRRSTRVSLKVTIDACGISEPLTCEGETIVVNLHGALISTPVVLKVGTIIEIEVYLTGKRAKAMIVYIDPNKPLHCGIALAKPENIWGVSLPPDDWREGDSESAPEPR